MIVSEVAKALDGELRQYHERELSDGYRFLFFDGVVIIMVYLIEKPLQWRRNFLNSLFLF